MDYLQKIQFAANSYYNRGLEMAKERDLSGAALYLKRALQFNKYHTDARNLLGLIFYEMGETSDALTQWVISINLQPENNRADHYLDEVQRKPGQLEIASQTIKKYNQALFHAQGGSDDLAVLQLKRIVEEKPNFVKAICSWPFFIWSTGIIQRRESPFLRSYRSIRPTRRPSGTWNM